MAGRLSPAFLSAPAQVELSTHVWELALLALPMTLIILTAGIDLSVGSTMALVRCGLRSVLRARPPRVAGRDACPANNRRDGGSFEWRVHRLCPGTTRLIVTLATLAAYRGIAEGISLGRPFSGFPAGFARLGLGTWLGLPIPGVLFLVALLATATLLARTPLGLRLSAIGYNEIASRYSGLAVTRIKLWLYTASGLTAAVAALLFVARRNTAKADIGTGMELDVITAVVLGGTSIFGGRGRLLGTVLGVLLIHETREFVTWQYARDELNLIVIGALLLLSVLADSLLSPRKR